MSSQQEHGELLIHLSRLHSEALLDETILASSTPTQCSWVLPSRPFKTQPLMYHPVPLLLVLCAQTPGVSLATEHSPILDAFACAVPSAWIAGSPPPRFCLSTPLFLQNPVQESPHLQSHSWPFRATLGNTFYTQLLLGHTSHTWLEHLN